MYYALPMKVEERKVAEELRRWGLTYREILEQVPVSKSTLSGWLCDIILTQAQQARIHGKNLHVRGRFVEYNRRKRENAIARHEVWHAEAKSEAGTLPSEVLKWVGVALYWGEGAKSGPNKVAFSNSDPKMIQFIMRWFREICHVPEHKFRISVQVHDDQGLEEIQDFWSKVAQIPRGRFTKPAVRVSRSSQRKRVNLLPYGTAHIEICDTRLFHRILGWIEGLAAPSYSGLVRLVLSQETGVRLPVGLPIPL